MKTHNKIRSIVAFLAISSACLAQPVAQVAPPHILNPNGAQVQQLLNDINQAHGMVVVDMLLLSQFSPNSDLSAFQGERDADALMAQWTENEIATPTTGNLANLASMAATLSQNEWFIWLVFGDLYAYGASNAADDFAKNAQYLLTISLDPQNQANN